MRTLVILVVGLSASLALAGEPAKPEAKGETAKAEMKDVTGKKVGDVTLEQTPHGVLLKADFKNLSPGTHAMHIHETGKCEPPFKTAGAHFNPASHEHGIKNTKGMHAGDMPNIEVPKDGAVKVEVLVEGISLAEGPTSVFDKDGSALIIHDKADDYVSNPAGNAGDRIACGVIEKSK
jgi:Cu-Zn family superoxide dismutase